METNSPAESEYELIHETELNIYKNVHLFFYTYNGNELSVLLNQKVGEENYKDFSTVIIPSDELPTFAISRLMATTFRGLFSQSNLNKLKNKQELNNEDLVTTDEFHWTSIWSNEAFMEWLDTISSNPIQFDNIKGTMVYFIEIPSFDLEHLNKNLQSMNYNYTFALFKYNQDQTNLNFVDKSTLRLMKAFDFDLHIQETLKLFQEDKIDYYVIIACKSQGSKKDQAGFFHFPALIPGIYRRNKEKWLYVVASSDELPDDNLLKKTKAIIIPGSDLNIYLQVDFLRKTEAFLINVLINYPSVKFLGLCFGMQLLVSALKGKVESMGTFVVGAEKIDLLDEFWDFKYVKSSKVEKIESFVIHQAHGDYVSILPDFEYLKLKTYASSQSCGCELLADLDERVLCFQGHPEYATEFSMTRMAAYLCMREKIEVTKENMIRLKEEFIKKEKFPTLTNSQLRKICHCFLKN